ncbi:MAG TPA: hypothetical protein VMH87_03395 [Pseudomonadales bacterium]|nr:hypothetical protein [Pseudomonadales bacterium]
MDYKLKSISRSSIHTLALAFVVGCSVAAASASVTYQINNGGLESFNVAIDGNGINGALAGGIQINQVGGDASMPANYVTVCTDIEGTLYLGRSYTYDTPTTPFSGQTGVNPTWGAINTPTYLSGNSADTANAAQAIQNAAYLFYTYGQLTSTGLGGTTEQKAALQLAVWMALYDTTASGTVTGSRFTVSGGDASAIAQADSWVSGLSGNYSFTGYLLYPDPLSVANNNNEPPQELLISTPVPEAPTVIAATLLLLPFGASAFKILRRKHNNNSLEVRNP